MKSPPFNLKLALQIGIGLAVVGALWYISMKRFLLFHVLVEMFSVVVAVSLFMVLWNARRFIESNYLMVLGIVLPFVGLMDMLHTLAYRGMGVLQTPGANVATQLWIGGRYLHAAALVAAPLAIGRNLKHRYILLTAATATAVLLASIFLWHLFPVSYVDPPPDAAPGAEGRLTAFKVVSEYVVCAVMALALGLLWWQRRHFDRRILMLLAASIVLLIAAELLFTLYTDVYGLSNVLGHLAKLGAFFAVYRAVVDLGVRRPAQVLMHDMHQSREALRDSEQRFRTVADFTYDWEYWRGPDGRLLYVSPSCHRMTGYRAEEFITEPELMLRITHPDDREGLRRHLEDRLTGDAQHVLEFRIITRSGDVRWISHVCQEVIGSDGHYLGRRSSNRDVTGRKHAEDQRKQFMLRLEHEQARLQAVIESAPEGIVVADADGELQLINPTARRLYEDSIARGYRGADDRSPSICTLEGAPYDLDALPLLRAARDGEPRTNLEIALVWPDGRRRDLLQNTAPIRDGQGRLVGAVAIFQDISSEHQFKAELVRRAQQLETLIREANHRIRNNLQSVLALIEVERPHLGLDGQASLNRCGNRIRAIATVHRLLTSEATSRVRLLDLLKGLAELAGTTHMGDGKQRVAIGVGGQNISVPSRAATSVAIVVNELIANALQHAFASEGEGRVHVQVERDGSNGIEITVDDNGRGCSPATRPGTGLSLTRAIVENDLKGRFDLLPLQPGCRCRVRFEGQEDADDHRRD